VRVVTNEPGERRLADGGELGRREEGRRHVVLVPEAITSPEVVELAAKQAGQGGAQQGALDGPLGQGTGHHVDVRHVAA